MKPLASGVILRPEEHTDAQGRRVRLSATQPCGCWAGEVYFERPIFFGKPELGTVRGWSPQTLACEVHSAKAVVLGFLMCQQSGEALPESAEKFLAEHGARAIREAEALDAQLLAAGHKTPTLPVPGLMPLTLPPGEGEG